MIISYKNIFDIILGFLIIYFNYHNILFLVIIEYDKLYPSFF